MNQGIAGVLTYQRVLVTGGAGFIGSHLVEALLKKGKEVICLDNFDPFYDRSIKEDNLKGALENPHFHLVEGDIRDSKLVRQLFEEWKIDIVVHLAAKAGVRPSLRDPIGYYDVNVNGTLQLLEVCREKPPLHFVFASSSSVYGDDAPVPFREDYPPDWPISPYAGSKRAGELACYTHFHLYHLPLTCLRFFTVYGPRQRPEMAIHAFVRSILQGKPIPLYGDLSSSRDYTYVGDIIQGILSAVERPNGHTVYNLGNSHPVALGELVSLIETVLGQKALCTPQNRQAGDVLRTYADIEKARRELNYQPKTSLTEGIGEFVKWFKNEELETQAAGRIDGAKRLFHRDG